jgi:hypothetical protein
MLTHNLWVMKPRIVILLLCLTACGGTLTEEQRRKLHEGMEEQKIVQMTDAEIMTTAHERGREVFAALEKVHFNPAKADSIGERYKARIHWTVPGTATNQEIEQQLIEAYISGMVTGSLQDNVQRLYTDAKQGGYDSILYSKPVVSPMPDGVEKLEGVWNIYLSKKQVVLTAPHH